ncbi:tetratricopeptide repeat protein [Nioella sediminis]|uniref:tetratricopeptide repeat protein n=1 Tax=Nioella sediminis TaxID=1912092 RepID=UPI00103E2BCF|nr:tetratricopeptide repeat protein [Nioella sediminis]
MARNSKMVLVTMENFQSVDELIEFIRALVDSERIESALELTQTGMQLYPDAVAVAATRVRILRRMDRHEDALDFALSCPPGMKTTALLPMIVELGLEQGRRGEVSTVMSGIPEGDFSSATRIRARSAFLAATDSPQSALDFLTGDLPVRKDAPWFVEEKVRILLQANREDEALTLLREYAPRSGMDRMIMMWLRAEDRAGHLEAAEEILRDYAQTCSQMLQWHKLAIDIARKRTDNSLALLRAQAGVERFPGNVDLRSSLWSLMMSSGRRDEAISNCQTFADCNRKSIEAVTKCLSFLSGAREDEACDRIMATAVKDLGPEPLLVFSWVDVLIKRQNPLDARRELESLPEEVKNCFRYERLRARIETALGNIPDAITATRMALEYKPTLPALHKGLADLHIEIGEFAEARKILADMPFTDPSDDASRHLSLFDAARLEGRFDVALSHAETALRIHPEDVGALRKLTEIQIILGNLSAAIEAHKKATRLRSLRNSSGKESQKLRNSKQGQLLNEYLLLADRNLLSSCSPTTDPAISAGLFRQMLEEWPANTPYALCVLAALNRIGAVSAAPPRLKTVPKASARIPRKLSQFWDTPEPPEQVKWVLEENRRLNPDYSLQVFNERGALLYMRERGEPEAARAFRLAPHTAAKSDIFRLVVLWHEGGVYLDADDRCLLPLSKLIDHNMRFIGYQEYFQSIGNNFIAVQPRDPIIRAALDDATTAFGSTRGENLWLASGPGPMTRSLALHGTNPDGSLQEGVWIMPTSKLKRCIAPHVALSYKTSDQHWTSQFKRSSSVRQAPASSERESI